jgi:hypothetical protein
MTASSQSRSLGSPMLGRHTAGFTTAGRVSLLLDDGEDLLEEMVGQGVGGDVVAVDALAVEFDGAGGAFDGDWG